MLQLQLMIDEAAAAGDAATLASVCTVGADGRPSARVVPVRVVDEGGIEIHTSLSSTKGRDIVERPDAVCALFFWPALLRQARVEGRAVVLGDRTSGERFATLPRRAQVRAWLAVHGTEVSGREVLVERARAVEERFADSDVPMPPDWSVVRIEPDALDLFQGATTGYVDDRIRYERESGSGWRIRRLSA